jgi:hypothetical protein
LSGEVPKLGGSTPKLAEHLLEHIDLSWPPLFLLLEQERLEAADRFIEDIETLLGVEARVLRVEEEEPSGYASLSQAARLLILAGGDPQGWREALDPGYPGLDGGSLMSKGRVLFVIGAAAAALGSWMFVESSNTIESGLGWVEGAILMPGVMDPADLELVRRQLQAAPWAYAVGLPASVLLALGPERRIEVWSEHSPVIALGSGWSQP